MKRLRPSDFLLPLSSAILLLAGFPPFDFYVVSWFALVPVLLMVVPGKPLRSFGRGYLAGLFAFGGMIWWLCYVHWLGYVALTIYMAFYFALPVWILSYFPSNKLRAFTLVPLWVGLEFFRSSGIFAFSWACLGHTQYKNIPLIQIAEFTGVYGVSAFLAAFSAALGYLWLERKDWRNSVKPFLGFLLVPSFIMLLGAAMLPSKAQPGARKVSLVQGNIPQDAKWEESMEQETINRYVAMTEKIADETPDLVVWPETALPLFLCQNPEVETRLKTLCKNKGLNLLTGALYSEGSIPKYYNSAFFITPDSLDSTLNLTRYDKMRLVPFGEYVPFSKWIPFVQGVVEGAGGGAFSSGTLRTLFKVKDTRFATLICFESTLPPIARQFVKQGAGALVVITNDEWFKRSPASLQHAIQSVFRAVENRVTVVRATNTGLTCFIDPGGRISKNLPRFEQGVLTDVVSFPGFSRTVYTRFGDWFAWLCLTIFFLCVAIRIGRRKGVSK